MRHVNEPQTPAELDTFRRAMRRGRTICGRDSRNVIERQLGIRNAESVGVDSRELSSTNDSRPPYDFSI